MESSIKIQEIGCCKFMNYGNHILGKYYLRTLRNGIQDIAFNGLLIGQNGINPYNFIKGCSLEDFEKTFIKIDESLLERYKSLLNNLFNTLYLFLDYQIGNNLNNEIPTESNYSYISKDKYGAITIGKRKLQAADFYEIIFFQNKNNQLVLKIKRNDPFGSPNFHENSEIIFISNSIYDGIKYAIIQQMSNMMKSL